MKKLMTAMIAGVVLSVATLSAPAQADTYKVDPAHAFAMFKVSHFGWSNNWGRFNDVTGSIDFDKADVTKSKVSITIKTASVDTNHDKRDAHLRSPDFFNAKEFPEMKFVSTKIDKTGDKTANVTGNLTLLGVTKPVTLSVTWNKEGPHFRNKDKIHTGFSATGTIKRSDFGMKKFVPAIGDTITLFLDVEAIKQ